MCLNMSLDSLKYVESLKIYNVLYSCSYWSNIHYSNSNLGKMIDPSIVGTNETLVFFETEFAFFRK